jgi:ApaG protein
LNSRHWDIFDALNNKEIVEGEGVIGQQPMLAPQDSHTYSSGCLLNAPFGTMSGFYTMLNFSTGKTFKVYIPAFSLNAPFALN